MFQRSFVLVPVAVLAASLLLVSTTRDAAAPELAVAAPSPVAPAGVPAPCVVPPKDLPDRPAITPAKVAPAPASPAAPIAAEPARREPALDPDSPRPGVAKRALRELADRDPTAAVPTLVEALAPGRGSEVRVAALALLGSSGEPAALSAVLDHVPAPDDEEEASTQALALFALACCDPAAARAGLERLRLDPWLAQSVRELAGGLEETLPPR